MKYTRDNQGNIEAKGLPGAINRFMNWITTDKGLVMILLLVIYMIFPR